MEIKSVFDSSFAPFGRVLEGIDVSELLNVLRETTEKPADAVIYVPSHEAMEALAAAQILQDSVYGGMPIQIGYCNGSNTQLGCLEYHRDSEINIPADDMVFLVAQQQLLEKGMLHTDKVEAFYAPAGSVVELYATTMHYAPCNGKKDAGFRVAVVLPRGTNTPKKDFASCREEDQLLWACNKWLIAHPNTSEAKQGAFVGLIGENPDIANDI